MESDSDDSFDMYDSDDDISSGSSSDEQGPRELHASMFLKK